MQIIKQMVKQSSLYHSLWHWSAKRRQQEEYAEWERRGRPSPSPHLVKQQTLRHYAGQYGLRVLVETGTYYGDMVEAMKGDFERIYSIELSKVLHEKAKERFSKYRHIELIQGDSGAELATLMKKIDRPVLFWLDGHYSADVTARGDKDTPIYEELRHIFSGKDLGHVIIIDDARCFGMDAGYPSLDELKAFIRANRTDMDIQVQNDSIRLTPLTG